jgi:DAACS family dicarboxylate/amino acid:cation (Na+ or H+) symporter
MTIGSDFPRGPRLSQAGRILLAMLLGGAVGVVLGPRAEPLNALGKVIIDLIRALAGPLVLFAILDAFLRTEVRIRSGGLMVAISLCNATLALLIGLTLSNLLQPGHLMREQIGMAPPPAGAPPVSIQKLDFLEQLKSYIPTNVVRPLLENSIVHIVILTILIGAALRHVKNSQIARGESAYRALEDVVHTVYRAIEVLLGWVILLIPIAVFGVIASTIGEHGFSALRGLGVYVGVAVLGLMIQVAVVYQGWIKLVSGRTLRWFWSGAKEPVVYAMGSSSSLATLPVTLSTLDRMKVTPQAARLSACVGTNLNNDGILLYEAMAVLCVAQFHGISLSVGQQLLAALACLVAGVGIAGIPDAGLISLLVVLTTVGLPLEIYPLLLSVDWLLSRCRAMTNVVSDVLVAVMLDRFGVGREGGPTMSEEGEALAMG